MEILFLGTGSGSVSLRRDHSSLLISHNNFNLLIDCGDGISKSLIKNQIGFSLVDAILISHFHPDHVDGISNLLNQMKLTGRKNKLSIYLHKNLINQFKSLTEISNIYLIRLGFEVELIPIDEGQKIILCNGFGFLANENPHLQKLKKYPWIDESKLISLSFLFSVAGKNIFYSGDINNVTDLYLFDKSKIEIMISEITHITLKEITEAYKNIKPGKLILTHIKDETESELLDWKKSVDEEKKIIIAYDGYKMEL